jgi:DNA modification methylase
LIQPDLEIAYLPLEDLIPYARNSRTHDDAQVAQIAASIKEFGFTNPILIDEEGGIIAGHGRVMAARKLSLEHVPTITLAGLTETQRKAYVIADNKLALNSGWDDAMLKLELDELIEAGFDISLTGFTEEEIGELDVELEEIEAAKGEDEIPEMPEDPITKLGDVWLLGKHRLMCGDSTSVDSFATLMGGVEADMIFTDPPYGMSYDGGRSKKGFGMIKNDDAQGADLVALVRDALLSARTHCKDGAAGYVCFPWRTYSEFEGAMVSIGMDITSCIVWNKGSVGLGHQEYRPQHEFIFYSKGGAWYGDRSQSDVWTLSRGNTGAYVHPTQKPVELIEIALTNSSKKGDVVIDCFGGSGSTMIGCEKTGRAARLMELDPKCCDVIVKRWQEFTGKTATLESDGRTFAEVGGGN